MSFLALAAYVSVAGGCTRPGQVIDTWEARSSEITIRVRQFNETPQLFFPQYYCSFEVQDKPSGNWRGVMMWMVDDPIPIQRQQVQFVTDSIVYAFGNAKYVVTTDGGRRWSEWDAKKALPNPEAYVIDSVLISGDGTGGMVVRRRTRENNGLAELTTADFGVHWTLKNEGPPVR